MVVLLMVVLLLTRDAPQTGLLQVAMIDALQVVAVFLQVVAVFLQVVAVFLQAVMVDALQVEAVVVVDAPQVEAVLLNHQVGILQVVVMILQTDPVITEVDPQVILLMTGVLQILEIGMIQALGHLQTVLTDVGIVTEIRLVIIDTKQDTRMIHEGERQNQ